MRIIARIKEYVLDVFALPSAYELQIAGFICRLLRIRDHVIIGKRSVYLRRSVLGIKITSRKISMQCFSGVSFDIRPRDDLEGFVYSVRLKHDDPTLCVPLHVAFDQEGIGASWNTWSKVLRLPKSIPDTHASVKPVQQRLGQLLVQPAIPRRRLHHPHRRPVFNHYREVGFQRLQKVVGGSEIIARD
jgi:hypothetical protein